MIYLLKQHSTGHLTSAAHLYNLGATLIVIDRQHISKYIFLFLTFANKAFIRRFEVLNQSSMTNYLNTSLVSLRQNTCATVRVAYLVSRQRLHCKRNTSNLLVLSRIIP